jgi:ferredoxin
MVTLKINGLGVTVEDGMTILEAAQFLGFPIPTLCHMEGLSPYGACRLCVVEIGEPGRSRLVTSCTHPTEKGMRVRTSSARVIRARRMVVELLLASAPQSKTIQDIASRMEVKQQRFRQDTKTASSVGAASGCAASRWLLPRSGREAAAIIGASAPRSTSSRKSAASAAGAFMSARSVSSAAPIQIRKRRYAAAVRTSARRAWSRTGSTT